MSTTFQQNWAVPPGFTIKDILADRNISVEYFAHQINYSVAFTNNLLSGSESITADVAKTLSETLGASSEFWLSRQSQYQNDFKRISIAEGMAWLHGLPLKDMLKFGWVKESENMLETCLDYFEVPNLSAWKQRYTQLLNLSAFRTSQTFSSEPASVVSWLRRGEIIGNSVPCKPWNSELFENSMDSIKSLTRKKNPADFIPILREICASCGVAIAVVRTPTGCRASGATMFLPDRALLLLSFRYLSDDQFWFTFFHEAGHLLLHENRNIYLEGMSFDSSIKARNQELEANKFAGEILIPHTLQPQLSRLKSNKRDIINFAMSAGISPGIVIGQLQHYGLIGKNYLNGYKRRYDWTEIEQL